MSCNDRTVRIHLALFFFPFPIINKSFATDGTLEILEEQFSRSTWIIKLLSTMGVLDNRTLKPIP